MDYNQTILLESIAQTDIINNGSRDITNNAHILPTLTRYDSDYDYGYGYTPHFNLTNDDSLRDTLPDQQLRQHIYMGKDETVRKSFVGKFPGPKVKQTKIEYDNPEIILITPRCGSYHCWESL